MARKSATATAHGAPSLALVAPIVAPVAPAPVAERKRARRAKVAAAPVEPPPPPVYVKPTVDLSRSDARKALAVAFPVCTDAERDATEEEARAARAYLDARDAATRAEAAKEAAGNVLRYAIGRDAQINGEGWKATWKFQKAEIDWGALVKELAIESAVIERFRKPSARVLLVRETVDGDGA